MVQARSNAVNEEVSFTFTRSEMVHAARYQAVATGGNVPCLRWIESVSGPNAERTLQDNDVLIRELRGQKHNGVPLTASSAHGFVRGPLNCNEWDAFT